MEKCVHILNSAANYKSRNLRFKGFLIHQCTHSQLIDPSVTTATIYNGFLFIMYDVVKFCYHEEGDSLSQAWTFRPSSFSFPCMKAGELTKVVLWKTRNTPKSLQLLHPSHSRLEYHGAVTVLWGLNSFLGRPGFPLPWACDKTTGLYGSACQAAICTVLRS